MPICTLSNVGFIVRWKGRISCLLPKWDSLYKHASHKKLEKNIGLMRRKGIGIIQKFPSMLKLRIAYFS
jgi:hypothetical protein